MADLSNKSIASTYCGWCQPLVLTRMQLDPRDPLLTVKVRALRPLLRKSTIPWDQLTAAEALQAARALSLREVSACPATAKQALRFLGDATIEIVNAHKSAQQQQMPYPSWHARVQEEAGSSCSEVINPRNEAAALSLLYKHVEGGSFTPGSI